MDQLGDSKCLAPGTPDLGAVRFLKCSHTLCPSSFLVSRFLVRDITPHITGSCTQAQRAAEARRAADARELADARSAAERLAGARDAAEARAAELEGVLRNAGRAAASTRCGAGMLSAWQGGVWMEWVRAWGSYEQQLGAH